ncbi:MAG: CHASE domain-containing protein, partial [Planctomycetota bacterium]
ARGIHSLALRGGGLVFGPESYAADDPLASPAGTVYERPAPEEFEVLRGGKPLTLGPYTNEYGSFVVAYAPVHDPRTGEPLMAVGFAIQADDWNAQVFAVRLMPILSTLALMAITLGGLSVIRWRSRLPEARQVRLHCMETVLVGTLGLALTLAATLLVLESERQGRRRTFEIMADSRADSACEEFLGIRDNLTVLGRYCSESVDLDREEFHAIAASVAARRAVSAYAWVPAVPAGEKTSASGRSAVYPIRYADPQIGNEAILGIDLESDVACRVALEEAVRSGLAGTTNLTAVFPTPDGQQRMLAIQPVVSAGGLTGGTLRGFVVAAWRPQAFLDHVAGRSGTGADLIELHLVDMMHAGGPKLLAVTGHLGRKHTDVIDSAYLQHYESRSVHPVFVLGRAYALAAHPAEAFYGAHPLRTVWLAGLGGLLLTAVITTFTGFLRNRQAFLERQVQERTAKLVESDKRFLDVLYASNDAILLIEGQRFVDCNDATARMLGYADKQECLDTHPSELSPPVQPDGRHSADKAEEMMATALKEGLHRFTWMHRKASGEDFLVEVTLTAIVTGGKTQLHCAWRDLTESKRAEVYAEMGRNVLQILNEPGHMQDSLRRVLAALKAMTRFDAVGMRLQDGDDFPYFAQDGFSKDFLLTENTLVERAADGGVCRDKDGNVRLECTCGLVILGKADLTNPLFTPGGSAWTNDSFPLLEIPTGEDPRLHPRNHCIHQGYASVALVPIRDKDRIVGLLQFNDRRKGCFTLAAVELLEGIASHIGSAIIRKRAERELREAKALTDA